MEKYDPKKLDTEMDLLTAFFSVMILVVVFAVGSAVVNLLGK